MHLGQGGPDHPSGKRRSKEEASGNEDGGANERGEKGAVDGLPPGTRLGKEGPMPWDVNKNSTKYLKSTISVLVSKSTKYSNIHHFVINVGRRNFVMYELLGFVAFVLLKETITRSWFFTSPV